MNRSTQWAALRGKSPTMPWTKHSDASAADRDFFDRLRVQRGSSAAIRLFKDLIAFMDIVRELPSDDDVRELDLQKSEDVDMMILRQQGDGELRAFRDRLEFRSPDEAAEFWAMFETWRLCAGGGHRRAVRAAARIAR